MKCNTRPGVALQQEVWVFSVELNFFAPIRAATNDCFHLNSCIWQLFFLVNSLMHKISNILPSNLTDLKCRRVKYQMELLSWKFSKQQFKNENMFNLLLQKTRKPAKVSEFWFIICYWNTKNKQLNLVTHKKKKSPASTNMDVDSCYCPAGNFSATTGLYGLCCD